MPLSTEQTDAEAWRTQKLNIEYFFTLKKTLETYPELADPTCNDVSVKGDGLWDGELLRRHASQNWDGVPQRQASRTWHVVEDEPDKVTVMGGSLQGARGRRPSRRLSLLTQPGASALMLMWHAPQVTTPPKMDTNLHHAVSDANSYWQHGSQLLPLRTDNCPQPRKLDHCLTL